MLVTRNVMMKYRSPADDGTGGGTGGGGDDAAAAAAAAAKKAEEDAAAAAAAAAAGTKTGPTDEEAKLIKEVMAKKERLKIVEGELEGLKNVAKQLEELGGLDALRALVVARKDEDTKKLEAKGEWERLKAQMIEEHGKEKATLSEQLTAVRGEADTLRATIAELTVGNAFASSQFINQELIVPGSKVRALYGSHFEFKDGSVVAYDKPVGSKDRTVLVDAKGDALPFDAALKKIVDADPDRDLMLKSKLKTGSGSKTVDAKGAPPKLDEPRGVSRISEALKKGELK